MPDREMLILPGDGEKPTTEDSDPTVILEESKVRDITDTTLADGHLPKRQLIQQIAGETDDWGDGFFVGKVPVHVTRAPDGSIVKTTPLDEIPGVTFRGGKLVPEEEPELLDVDAVSTPAVLSREDRRKLVGILAGRLFDYYRSRGPNDPRFNPFRDGIPELPAGSPQHIQPLPGTELYPATDAQIHQYLKRFIGERVSVIDKNRFGGGHLQDMALRVE
jgi:hypothetical protein